MMPGLDLTGANLENMDFRSASMPDAIFTNSKLDGALFSCKSGLYISDYWLPTYRRCWEASLQHARFQTQLSRIDFSHARMDGAYLGGVLSALDTDSYLLTDNIFDGAAMDGASIKYTKLSGNSFKRAHLRRNEWTAIAIKANNSFAGADLSGTVWWNVTFKVDAQQNPSDFTDANLSNIRIKPDVGMPEPPGGHFLSEQEMPSKSAILCRTRFDTAGSNRDCAPK